MSNQKKVILVAFLISCFAALIGVSVLSIYGVVPPFWKGEYYSAWDNDYVLRVSPYLLDSNLILIDKGYIRGDAIIRYTDYGVSITYYNKTIKLFEKEPFAYMKIKNFKGGKVVFGSYAHEPIEVYDVNGSLITRGKYDEDKLVLYPVYINPPVAIAITTGTSTYAIAFNTTKPIRFYGGLSNIRIFDDDRRTRDLEVWFAIKRGFHPELAKLVSCKAFGSYCEDSEDSDEHMVSTLYELYYRLIKFIIENPWILLVIVVLLVLCIIYK